MPKNFSSSVWSETQNLIMSHLLRVDSIMLMLQTALTGACRNFSPTAEQILNLFSGMEKCSGIDVSMAKMGNFKF